MISGSDQIWRGSLKYKNISAFFLNFGSQKIRRIAYAPSFGLKDYYKGEIYLLKQALKRYYYLSCREFDGVKICKQAGYEVEKVVDPTLLLDESDYRKLLVPLDKRDYVFIYSLNLQSAEDIFWSDLKNLFDNTHRVVTPANGYFPGKELFEDVDYKYSTPYEWLSLIYNSKLVVTSSFHGVVFSIIFNKKFAFVPLKGKLEASNNRVLELLDLLDLNNTIINNGSDYVRILSNDIDWNVVNDRRKVIVEKSKLFLTDALKH